MRKHFQPWLRDTLAKLEHGSGTKGHRWFIVPLGSSLYFMAKNIEQYPLYLLYGAYAKSETNKKQLSCLLGPPSYTTWTTEKHIDPVILQQKDNNDVSCSLNEQYSIAEQVEFIGNMSGECGDSSSYDDIRDVLSCPVCKKGDLTDTDNEKSGRRSNLGLSCTLCNRTYPIINGVPVLLPDSDVCPE